MCVSFNAATAAVVSVYPTGSVSLDIANVQTAIDAGGTVLLKAKNRAGQATAFNFGTGAQASGVNINTDVSIVGERVGRYSTTISGGFVPILGFVRVKSTIQGIDFEGPIDSPIVLAASSGADIIGNRVRGNIPAPLCAPPCTHTEIEGLLISGYNDPANAVTGHIRVIDNDFELSGGSFANGMQFDEVAADIEVRGNNVKFLQTDGIVQTIGILVFRSRGRASVVANSVTIGPGNPDAYPAGIFVAGHEQAQYFIFGNSVTTNHPNADGIDVLGMSNSGATQHAIVEGNFVTMHSTLDTAGGIAFGGAVSDSLMAANVIRGTSGNALQILGFDSTLPAVSNAAIGNDISRLTSLDSDVYFGEDSSNNVVIGRCNTYQDFGTGNRISCGHAAASLLLTSPSPTQAPAPADRPRPMLDLLGNTIRPAGLDGIRKRLAH
jgi:hypothetical protein